MKRRIPLLTALLLTACDGETFLDVDGTRDAGREGVQLDAGLRADAGASDTGVHDPRRDAGARADAGLDGGATDAGPPAPCGFDELGAADRDRVVLVSHPFSDDLEVPGTDIRSLTLRADGTLVDDGARLDVGFRVDRIAFVPSGELALVLGERGELLSVRVGGVADIAPVDQVQLPSAGYGALSVRPDGETVVVVGSNSTPTGGLSTVQLGCDGALTVRDDLFYALRLADDVAFTPDGAQAWVFGGQALFDPRDEDDVRLLDVLPGGGFAPRAAFDVFTDFATTDRIALSPDGRTLMAPNGLDFSGEADQLAVLTVDGDGISSRQRIAAGLPGLAEVMFSADGRTLVATLAEPNRVVALAEADGRWSVTDEVRGVGLADQIARVTRGTLADTFYVPSLDTDGVSNIARLRVSAQGALDDLGQLDLGMPITEAPKAIAISP